MKETKHRGVRVDNGEWEYGDILQGKYHGAYIVTLVDDASRKVERINYAEVYPNTVGQYIGIEDKNGVKIYEGDVVIGRWFDSVDDVDITIKGVIEYYVGWGGYWLADYDNKMFSELSGNGYYHWDTEVVGNAHENAIRNLQKL